MGQNQWYEMTPMNCSRPQFCSVVNDSTMTCLAPGLAYSKPNPPEGALHPDEFGFIFDQVTHRVDLSRP